MCVCVLCFFGWVLGFWFVCVSGVGVGVGVGVWVCYIRGDYNKDAIRHEHDMNMNMT